MAELLIQTAALVKEYVVGEQIVAALRALSSNATVSLESAVAVAAAIDAYEQGPADFADCLLCTKAAMAGCDEVATFDRGMRRLPNVKML